MTDQIIVPKHAITAPYVGYSLSTPQLFLVTNNGYQVFKNSLIRPQELSTVQVAAVLQNTFAAGMYMSGGGDFPILMNDCDLSNVTFTLTDSNFHPLSLRSPMYVFLKIDPADNPAADISAWRGRLPVDSPLPLQSYTQPSIPSLTEQPQPQFAFAEPPSNGDQAIAQSIGDDTADAAEDVPVSEKPL
jgi:hypothetical protein